MRQVRWSAILALTLLLGLVYPGGRIFAQEAQSLAPIQLTFPLKATVPNQDQHLTPSSAPVNSVFDHSMLDATTHYVIYGCDKTVVAVNGTRGVYGPGYPILGVGCNAGYKVQNVQNPPPISLAPDVSYSGWGLPGYLFYDGHPGIDYVAAMDTQVYAVVNGTIHYPTRMVGLGYPAAAYHTLEIVPDHAPVLPPPYVLYYLHLDTYIGQDKIPVNDPDPLPGCAATVYLPLDEGTHVQGGCLIGLSGKAAPPIYHYLPHLHFEVHKVVPGGQVLSRFGTRTADVCIDGVVSSAYDCVPVDPYGWTGDQTVCDPGTGLADSGDPYYCLTGITSVRLWQ
jgi:murein DD-endopeptidase MepM/ murein hydrolase activator NlpD